MHRNLALARGASFILTGCYTATYVLYNFVSTQNIKKKLRSETYHEILPLPTKVQTLVDEVIQDIKLSGTEFKVTAYMTKNSYLSNEFSIIGDESLIGIPQHFIYDEENGENLSSVVDKDKIPQDAPEHQSLKHSVCLSRDAKKYVIAYEMFISRGLVVFPNCVLPFILVLHCNFQSVLIEKFIKPPYRQYHLAFQLFQCLLAPILYISVLHFFNAHGEYNSNLRAANLGKSYRLGGIEYCKKMIQENEISKASKNTESGLLVTSTFRKNCLPLKEKLTYLEDTVKGNLKSRV